MNYKRIFIEKKVEYNSKRGSLLKEFREYLGIEELEDMRYINVYDIVNISDEDYEYVKNNILFDRNVDYFFEENLPIDDGDKYFRVEYVKGQFNNREDALEELIKITLMKDDIRVKNSRILCFKGIDEKAFEKIKSFYINPVELKEIGLEDFTFKLEKESSQRTEYLDNFNNMNDEELLKLKASKGIGLDLEDLRHCQEYFTSEGRDPSVTEIKLIDTYWSDHCRHTTFMAALTDIEFEDGRYKDIIENAFKEYLESRDYVYGETDRPICLMDIGTLNTKEIKKKGLLDDLEESEEVNAASIEIDIKVDGKDEKWLLMFKNETHNHPTEIEPFGGASTCLGGAIRDPLSGRSYVYQAMRITGAKNPLEKFEDTLTGKLPQRKISREAMEGYSSYGNEIGVPAGFVREIYDDGYVAKRMEVGALVAAAPKENVLRESPVEGDVIVLVGGRTGKDGLGGAVGSSQGHTEDSLEEGGAEVQKGNPKLERKIMRLFRKERVSKMIKMCNDFGAGGVSVAIGELADGLVIDLDSVPVKYPGMSGTDIALSESQERMAVVLDKSDVEKFLEECEKEDVEGTVVAEVKKEKRLIINYKDEDIVNISREFLDTNGIRKEAQVLVENPENKNYFELEPEHLEGDSFEDEWLSNVRDINIASQKGLVEKFDHTVGKGTVLMPVGGKNRISPAEGMSAKIPVLDGHTDNVSMMTFGYDPKIAKWSPFHGGMYAVIESVAKMVAMGGDYRKIRFSFQEYFERLEDDRAKWGKPFSALLGAFLVDKKLDLPSIGGKDSMSGSFEDIDVPPTLISFAVNYDEIDNILSPEFKETNSRVILVENTIDEDGMLDFEELKENYLEIKRLVDDKKVLSASSIKHGGISRSITEMALGNGIGFEFADEFLDLYLPLYGSIILEVTEDADVDNLVYRELGNTIEEEKIIYGEDEIELETIMENYKDVFEEVFPLGDRVENEILDVKRKDCKELKASIDKPKVLIPIFTGSHGEYDMARSFINAGGDVEFFVFKTLDVDMIDKSYDEFARKIREANILAFPDGAVLGNEPEGSGKLVKNILKEQRVKSAVMDLLDERDGLILGIGEGFSALLSSGLIPYGKIVDDEEVLTLTRNKEDFHKSTIEEYEIVCNCSPWLKYKKVGERGLVPFSRSEGRLTLGENTLNVLKDKVKIVSQFKESTTGDRYGIEALTCHEGRILGKLGSSERMDRGLFKNIGSFEEDNIFKAGIDYFKK